MRPLAICVHARGGALLVAALGCGTESSTREPPPITPSEAGGDAPTADAAPFVAALATTTERRPWAFAVLSDLHLPNPRARDVDKVVAAVIAMKVRLVVIAGDSTNGNPGDAPRTYAADGWHDVTRALQPLRDAGIAVLPVAGNHDSSTASQREHYAAAFRDLAGWAAPFVITVQASDSHGHARAPFSYSVDVDGVHLSLVHLVTSSVEPEVARWLASDLEAAAGATHRIVFGHVPMSSVIYAAKASYVAQLGAILERGRATMHVAGHEHLVWDEDVALPGGQMIREVLIGCSSGFYQYAPKEPAKARASCTPLVDPTRREPMRCQMPRGGGTFEIARGRKNRHLQHARTTFTVFSVDGASIEVTPMTIDAAGRPIPFYLDRE